MRRRKRKRNGMTRREIRRRKRKRNGMTRREEKLEGGGRGRGMG